MVYTNKRAHISSRKNLFLCSTLALTTITSISAYALSSLIVFADDVIDNVAVTVQVACTMSGTGMSSHSAEVVNGTYRADIGTTTLKAFCNDPNGFSIYAIGFTGDEYTGANHTKLVGTSASGNATIATGTTTSGSTSNWAMKLATNSSATYPITLTNGYGSYSNVPDTYTKVAQRTSGTDVGTGATGSELTTTYAAFISSTQQPDTYVGKVKYTLVHPYDDTPAQPVACTAGKICYQPNTTKVTGQMGDQPATNNTETMLYASNFKRTGYGFAGWNTAFDYSGTYYGPNQTITTPSDIETNGLSLYAVWVESAGTLQNWSGCSSLAQGAVTALTDSRDGNTYAVAKLADGKCWMIENLRLADKDSNNNDINLSSSNTNNPSLPLNNSWYYYNRRDTLITSDHLSPTTNPSVTTWCQTASSDCDNQSMLATNNSTLFINNTSSNYSTANDVYSYGNYYNWYSATAGHGIYSSASGFQAPGDICPAGWHLPKGGDKSQESINEYWQLIVTGINDGVNPSNYESSSTPYYNGAAEATPVSNALRAYPNNFVYSGMVGGSIGGRSSFGGYLSASARNTSYAYYLNFYNNGVYPATDSSYKYLGWMVRCLADS